MLLLDEFNVHHDVQLEKGVDGLFNSFARLDSRISSVGQTAAKIGDHLQVKLYLTLFPCALLLFSSPSPPFSIKK